MTRKAAARRGGAPAPESRSLVVVAMASMAVGLLAFVLGVRYGLDRGDQAQEVAASDALHRLDQQAVRLRALRQRERAQLSFHQTLAGPAQAPARRAPAAPAPAPPPRPAPPPAEQGAAPPSPVDSAASSEERAAGADDQESGEEAGGGEIDTAGAAEAEDQDVAPRLFALQVGAFPDQARANALVEQLTAKGYRVHIAAAEVEGKGTWYRVRVGTFTDRSAADEERSRFASREGLFALVVPEG